MIRKIIVEKKLEEKNESVQVDSNLFQQKRQIPMINQLYLNQSFEGCSNIERAIKKKITSYRSQDVKKSKFDSDTFIKFDEVVEKLVISKLKCKYCRRVVTIMYKNKREPLQWTLDRVDNDLGHTNANTIVACLKCNLERRCVNDKKFEFTKQMRLIKKN